MNHNHELIFTLYHNRTHAVTEAYGVIIVIVFKLLNYSFLICGMCFCIQLPNINKYSGQSNRKKDVEYQEANDYSRHNRSGIISW
ncbi:MAG: hypothetical protein JWR05_9 [Mucilaginibacter sp.]|nr:hypothetical protein [Mucilaginibacter sp.]